VLAEMQIVAVPLLNVICYEWLWFIIYTSVAAKIWSITTTACKHRDKRFSFSLVIVAIKKKFLFY